MSQQELGWTGESEQWEASNNIEKVFNLLSDIRFEDALKFRLAAQVLSVKFPSEVNYLK